DSRGPRRRLQLAVAYEPTGALPVRLFYSTGAPGRVRLTVFDVGGRLVRNLFDAPQDAGAHSWSWDRRDDRGEALARGVYFARLMTREDAVTRRVVLLR